MTSDTTAAEALDKLTETRQRLVEEIRKSVIGQDEVIEQLLISMPWALPVDWYPRARENSAG